jgi:hypothetical protein
MALEYTSVPLAPAHQQAIIPEWIVLKGKILSQRVLALQCLADIMRCIACTGIHAQAVTIQILKALIEHASENIYSTDIDCYFQALQLVLSARDFVSSAYYQSTITLTE